jgi:hypothetical protein
MKKLLMKASGHGGPNPVRANPALPITDRAQVHGPDRLPWGTRRRPTRPSVGAPNDPETGLLECN